MASITLINIQLIHMFINHTELLTRWYRGSFSNRSSSPLKTSWASSNSRLVGWLSSIAWSWEYQLLSDYFDTPAEICGQVHIPVRHWFLHQARIIYPKKQQHTACFDVWHEGEAYLVRCDQTQTMSVDNKPLSHQGWDGWEQNLGNLKQSAPKNTCKLSEWKPGHMIPEASQWGN